MIEEPTVQLNKFSKTKCKENSNSKLQYLFALVKLEIII